MTCNVCIAESGLAVVPGAAEQYRPVQVGYGASVASPTAYKSTVTNTWDGADRLTDAVDTTSGHIHRDYDGLDDLQTEVSPQGTVGYTYDTGGRRKTMTVQGQPTVTYTWDDANRLTQVQQAAGAINGNIVQTVKFNYDNANRRTQTTLANGIVAIYGYDDANELKSITYNTSTGSLIGNLTYSYDAAGRRISVGGSLANVQPGIPVSVANFDANNRLTNWGGQTLAYDKNGNLTSDGTNTYVWNERNQLASITGAVAATFQYDSFGRRIGKTVAGNASSFLYDGLNAVQLQSGATTTSLLSGGGIDELYATISGTQQGHLMADAIGSTIAITDATQTVKGSYAYDAYGNTTASGTATTGWQYTGRENDGTGLYFYRARYYSPKYGRFISEDPIGWDSGQADGYQYVAGSPLSLRDPFGLWAWGDPINQGLVNFAAGFGDATTLGLTTWIRNASGTNDFVDYCSSTYTGGALAGLVGGMIDGQGEAQFGKWVFGAFKSEKKWMNQLAQRGWTPELITEAIESGESVPAANLVNQGNSATRFISPTSGQSVVIDNVTNELLHVGGPGFKY